MKGRAVFLRSLSTLMSAGVPVHRALDLLGRQGENPALCEASLRMSDAVCRGHSLESSFQSQGIFSSFQVRLVQAGVEAGGLSEVLQRLADYEESSERDGMKVASALVYPLFVLSLCLVMLVAGPTYLLSSQFELLDSLGMGASPPLRMLQSFSQILCSWPSLLLMLAAAARAASWLRQPAHRQRLMARLVRLPGLRGIFRDLAVTRFCRAMSVQLKAGLPVSSAVILAAAAADHPDLTGEAARQALCDGYTVRESLAKLDFFPRQFLEYVTVGEESGSLDRATEGLGDIYQQEFEGAVETLLNTLQPAAMLLTGIVATAVMLVTMLPMVKAIQSL